MKYEIIGGKQNNLIYKDMFRKKISFEDKIDYIYDTLQKQESRYSRGVFFKWFFRLFILAYLYYFMTYWLWNILETFKNSMTPDLVENLNLDNINKEELLDKFKSLYNK